MAITSGLVDRLQAALAGRYRIERELGQGGTALVFAATDLRQPRRVAIKVLRPELAALIGPGRFVREISISAQFSHPHILPLFDSGESDGLPWFAMPLVEGESLRARLTREPQLPLEEALRITREVVDALSHAHAQGIIHRDIKPENILLSRGHAVVADFGIARALDVAGGDRLTETGMAVGTPAYMSPEQASGKEPLDARSDQYSLACVLYEMLAGTPPFAAPNAQGVLSRHLVDSPPPIRTVRNTVPVHVETAILAAMAKAKADRFASAAEFMQALDGTRQSPSQPYPSVLVASSRVANGRSLVGLAAAGLLGTAAVGFAFWHSRVEYLPDRVVVAPLEVPAHAPTLEEFGRQLLTRLTDAIGQEGVGEPVPAARVRQILTKDDGTSGDLATYLARQTSAGLVLRSACLPKASRAACEVELLRMPGSIPRLSFTAEGDPADPSFGAELVERAAVVLLLQQRWGDRTTWRGEYIPRSLDAVRELNEGYDLTFAGNDSAAGPHFIRAYLLDTAWVLAFPGIHDSAGLANLSLRPGLRPGDREFIGLFQAVIRRDWERAYELAARRATAQPEIWYPMAVLTAHFTGRPAAALRYFSFADSVKRTELVSHRFAGYAMHHLARYEDEIKLAAEIREQFPRADPLYYRTTEIMGRAGAGDVEGVRRVVAEAEASTEANVGVEGTFGTRGWIAGMELMAHGHEMEGRTIIETISPIYQRLRQQHGPAGYAVGEVEILLVLHHLDEANALALESLPHQKAQADSIALIGLLGQIAALRGARDAALRYSAWARQVAGTNRWDEVRARIAARLGDREGAVRFLQSSRATGEGRHFSLHRDPAFATLRGYPPFQQFIKPKG